jgi:hypothetical protein
LVLVGVGVEVADFDPLDADAAGEVDPGTEDDAAPDVDAPS